MIKTLSINLGGRVFQINENAYQELSNYLDHLNEFYNNTEGKDEIISDIESRFAEIFTEKVNDKGRSVVALHDTMEVIEMMGKPEDFDIENKGENKKTQNKKENDNFNFQTGKRFYRDTENGVVAGVCSGIAAYFGVVDPVWIRLLFLLLFFAGGSSFLIYFILWIAIQEAKTNTQKLEMKGERINLENLEKSVREELSKAGNNISNFVSKKEEYGGLSKLVNFIGSIFLAIFNGIFWIGKHFLYFIASILIIVLFLALITVIICGFALIPELTKYVFDNSAMGVLGIIGAILFVLGPLLLLILGLVKVWSSKIKIGRPAIFSILGATLIGLILVCISCISLQKSFNSTKTDLIESSISIPNNNQLILNANEMDEREININIFGSNLFNPIDGKGLEFRNIKLEIVPTYDTVFDLKTKLFSRGSNNINAAKNMSAIKSNVAIDGNILTFDPFFFSGSTSKWRGQKVRQKLSMPEGATIVIGKNMRDFISEETWQRMDFQSIEEGSIWEMKNGKLISLSPLNSDYSNENDSNLKTIKVSDFDELYIDGNIEVEIKPGKDYKVMASSDFDKSFKIYQNTNDLHIESKNTININAQMIKVIIVTPSIEKIKLSGSSSASISGFSVGDLEVNVSGNSTFISNVELNDFDLTLSGASSAKLKGSCENLTLECSGASNVKGDNFEIEDTKIDISGASEIKIYVRDIISGSVSGASSVVYLGNPEQKLEINGASVVRAINQ